MSSPEQNQSPDDFDELSTLHVDAPILNSDEDRKFAVTVMEGPDRGTRFIVDGVGAGPVFIGQGPTCLIRLSDKHVSRRHAHLEVVGGKLLVTDLQSTNGTFVDGVAVTGAYLRGGELLRIGSSALRIDDLEEPPSPPPAKATRFGNLVGVSLEIRRAYALAARLAATDMPILLEGETGTGKEVMAEAIHEASPRSQKPYVVFDCTSVAPSVIESELFGHEKGAFTGAVGARKGVFESADTGTLFIDEIGDLEPSLQSKLLRAIDRQEIRRVGSTQQLRVNVRIIAATRRDLDHEVQEGRFRDDLLHRLAVGRIDMPPLRRRKGDVLVLARHFWNELGGRGRTLPQSLVRKWEDYAWPGNVRELRNAVIRRLALGDSVQEVAAEEDVVSALPSNVFEDILASRAPFPVARMKVIQAFEQAYIERVLSEHGGNVLRAAQASGIARRYFQIIKARLKK